MAVRALLVLGIDEVEERSILIFAREVNKERQGVNERSNSVLVGSDDDGIQLPPPHHVSSVMRLGLPAMGFCCETGPM